MSDELSRVQCVLKSEFNLATLTGSFQPMNTTGFSDDCKILKIYNPSTTVSIDVSLDGVNPHDFIPPLGTLIVDFQTNHYDGPIYGAGTLNIAKGQILWGRTAANPTYLQIVGYR
jgi:hypothetical protein